MTLFAKPAPVWPERLRQCGELGGLTLDHDWRNTAQGPLEGWSPMLASLTEAMLRTTLPAAIVFAADHRLIFNAPLARLLGPFFYARLFGDATCLLLHDRSQAIQLFERAFAGHAVDSRRQPLAGEGGVPGLCVDVHATPLTDADGIVACVQLVLISALLAQNVDDVADGRSIKSAELHWRHTADGYWAWSNPEWSELTGLSAGASDGLGWLAAVHPQDHGEALQMMARAALRKRARSRFRVRDAATRRYRMFEGHGAALHDEANRIVEWLNASRDVDELHVMQQQQFVLLNELRHRVRNALGIVRAIARRTAEASTSVDEYAMHFEGRLDAMARIQSLLSLQPMAGATLESLIAGELMAVGGREDEKVDILGPPLRFRQQAAEIFGLAIHELVTNAVKFGALSCSTGKLAIAWHVSDDASRTLNFSWKEISSQTFEGRPTHRGFGLDLLERALPYELDCRTSWAVEADGVRCLLGIPVGDRIITEEDILF